MSEIKTEGSFKIKAPEKKEPVAEQIKEAPEEVKYTYHDTIHFMSLAKESNNVKVYLTEPNNFSSWLKCLCLWPSGTY